MYLVKICLAVCAASCTAVLYKIGQPTFEELKISVVNPRYPNMSTVLKRLESFRRYRNDDVVDRSLLVEAGFFYTGTGDEVECFWCAGFLENWTKGADPWIDHAM